MAEPRWKTGLTGMLLMFGAATTPLAVHASTAAPRSAAAPPALQRISDTVTIDGSSTVFPVSLAMGDQFQREAREAGWSVDVQVAESGTGGGFRRFCAGETDISNASRPISQSEIEACAAAGIQYIELPIAVDGLSVVVHPANTFVESMTVGELRRMWEPAAQGTITRWSQIRPEWPDRELRLYGPGGDSGTFDFFTQVINGRERASRLDYTASEDDNDLVRGVTSDPDALGYFGYAYYAANADKLRVLAIDGEGGGGAVRPSLDAVTEGRYTPLARPLFIYVKLASLERPEVLTFVRFYFSPLNATPIIRRVGYLALPTAYYQLGLERLETRQSGTVFGGQLALGARLEDLFGTTPR